MTLALIVGAAVGLCGALFALALWDGLRRALDAQVRLAEVRVEGMHHVELEALETKLRKVREELAEVRSMAQSNMSAVVAGRVVRR